MSFTRRTGQNARRLDRHRRDGPLDVPAPDDKGYATTVYNRRPRRRASRCSMPAPPGPTRRRRWPSGPTWSSPSSAFPADVREVFLGQQGALAGSEGRDRAGGHDHQRAVAGGRDLTRRPRRKASAALDAPVSGGDVGAKNATLSIMVGGDADAVEAVRPLLECMGKTIVHQGPAGAGQHTKMVNQILIASDMIGVCEALLYGYKAGLDLKTVLQSVGGGAAASWSLNNLGPRIIDRNFEPGFYRRALHQGHGHRLSPKRGRCTWPCRGWRLRPSYSTRCRPTGWAGRERTRCICC